MPKSLKHPDSRTKTIVKEMLDLAGSPSMKAAYDKRAAMFPEEKVTTIQNISGRLQKDSTPFLEVVQLAEANGLKIRWVPLDAQDEATETKPTNDELNEAKEDSQEELMDAAAEGLAVVSRGDIDYLITGRGADKAAEYLEKEIPENASREQELVAVGRTMRQYGVSIRFVWRDQG